MTVNKTESILVKPQHSKCKRLGVQQDKPHVFFIVTCQAWENMCAEFDPSPPRLRSSEIPLVLALILGAGDLHRTKCTCDFQSGRCYAQLLTCYQYVMVTWDAESDVCKNIFASVVALKHCILLKHLEIGQTCSLCFHLHVFKTLLAASLSSMTGGI